ncbi:MAG: hypothetical protein ABR499_08040 [Gemmatimonadaceae bacterium]
MRSSILAAGLVVLGVAIAVGWSVFIFPGLAMAEAGPGPDFWIRLVAAAPIAGASTMLIAGGKYGFRSLDGIARATAGRVAFTGAALLGVIVALCALAIIVAWA